LNEKKLSPQVSDQTEKRSDLGVLQQISHKGNIYLQQSPLQQG